MNGYDLSRTFWDFAFENPEKIKPIHPAIYFFAIEHCNRLGWKEKFGLPSQMVMEAIGVKNWKTYSQGLKELIDFGFVKMIEKSTNQYSSNIIAIVNFTKAPTKALDKALSKHGPKHSPKHSQSTVSINKQETIKQGTIEQLNNNTPTAAPPFNFKNSFIDLGVNEATVIDFIQVRKAKRAANTETAFNRLKKEIEKSGQSAQECIEIAVMKGWQGFEAEWIKNTKHQTQQSKSAAHVHTGVQLDEVPTFKNKMTL